MKKSNDDIYDENNDNPARGNSTFDDNDYVL